MKRSFDALSERYLSIRGESRQIAEPLSPEDRVVQAAPFASPVSWHLGHTTWFFEQFLLNDLSDYRPFNRAWDRLFNSYYESLGERVARDRRGLQTRPGAEQILEYRNYVDEALVKSLERGDLEAQKIDLLELGLQHEQQHQELMWYDLKYLLSGQVLEEAYSTTCDIDRFESGSPAQWTSVDEGVFEIGFEGEGFAYDNEGPRHRRYVHPGQLRQGLITNAEYLAFIEAGGYRDPMLWHSEAWAWKNAQAIEHPLYWRREADTSWSEYRLSGREALDPRAALSGISWFEAAAFCRWADWHLPDEAQWETVARSDARSFEFGQLWEFSASAYTAYPGYSARKDAAGEYNGKFMVNQMVLRGSSRATPKNHSRPSYRNFFSPDMRWMFAGIRPFRYTF